MYEDWGGAAESNQLLSVTLSVCVYVCLFVCLSLCLSFCLDLYNKSIITTSNDYLFIFILYLHDTHYLLLFHSHIRALTHLFLKCPSIWTSPLASALPLCCL